jgi:hypothetical protein
MKRFLPLGVAVLGLGIFVYAVFFASSDEDEIRDRLELLASSVEVTGQQENIVLRGARIRDTFESLFTKEVVIEIPELTSVSTGRMELVSLATQAPSWYRSASVDVSSLDVQIDDAGLSAHVVGPVILTATRLSGEPIRDRRTVSLRFDKIDDDWRIVGVTVSAPEGETQP